MALLRKMNIGWLMLFVIRYSLFVICHREDPANIWSLRDVFNRLHPIDPGKLRMRKVICTFIAKYQTDDNQPPSEARNVA